MDITSCTKKCTRGSRPIKINDNFFFPGLYDSYARRAIIFPAMQWQDRTIATK